MPRKAKEYLPSQVINMLQLDISQSGLKKAEQDGRIPEATRRKRGNREYRYWPTKSIPQIGSVFGGFKRPKDTIVISTYVPKGGVGKTAWTFNFSRLLALNGIKVLGCGFDFQCSFSKSFGIDYDGEDLPLSIFDAIVGDVKLQDIVLTTDIPTLDIIPESDELSMLDRQLIQRNRREYILEDLLTPIKHNYDVILLDCPPQWLEMVTNSLNISNAIICPVLADGESYHSFKKFMRELQRFMDTMRTGFDYVKFIPNQVDTRSTYTSSFREKFLRDFPDVFTTSYLRSSVQVRESGTAQLSISEYAPQSLIAADFYNAALEVWNGLLASIDHVEHNHSHNESATI